MIVIIYGHTIESALRKLNELYLEQEQRLGVKMIKKLKNGFDYLINDDVLVVVRAFSSKQFASYKQFTPDIGYVDVRIPIDIRQGYIYPRVFLVHHFLGKDS